MGMGSVFAFARCWALLMLLALSQGSRSHVPVNETLVPQKRFDNNSLGFSDNIIPRQKGSIWRVRETELLESFVAAQKQVLQDGAKNEWSTKGCKLRGQRLRKLANVAIRPGVVKEMVRTLDNFALEIEKLKAPVQCQGVEIQSAEGYIIDGRLVQRNGRSHKANAELVYMSIKRALVDKSHSTGLGMRLLLVRVVPSVTSGSVDNLEGSFVAGISQRTNEYFIEASGGLQSFDFVLHSSVVRVNHFTISQDGTCYGPGGAAPNSYDIASAVEEQLGKTTLDRIDRIVFSLPYCASLGYGGLGEAPGKRVWMNGMNNDQASFAGTLCHELGHTNGALHAEHEELEYGNTFSIMGRGRGGVPDAHFSLGAKVAFGWVDLDSQIVTLGKDCHLASATASCRESGTYWVQAHDYGTYASNEIYGLRIMLPDDRFEHLWVEFRQKYYSDELTPGAMLVWAYDEGKNMYGPTQLVDFTDTTISHLDATIPVGQSYAYDIEANGASAIVSVLAIRESAVQVFVRFVSDQERKALLDQASSSIDQIECDTPLTIGVDEMPRFLHLPVEHPSDLVFDQVCASTEEADSKYSGGLDADKQGIYIYPRIPLHMFLGQGFQDFEELDVDLTSRPLLAYPGAGATFFQAARNDCSESDAASCSISLANFGWLSGDWTISFEQVANGLHIYRDASKSKFLIYAHSYVQDLSGDWVVRNAWFVTNYYSETIGSYFGYLVPSSGDADKPLTDAVSIEWASFGSSQGFVKSEDTTVACAPVAWTAQTKLADLMTVSDVGSPVSYLEFSSDNYVLVDSKAPVTLTLSCTVLHCAANHYFDQGSSQCKSCPNGEVSPSNSQGVSSCYEPCETLWLASRDQDAFPLYDGIWTFVEVVNGMPSFGRYGNGLGSGVTDQQLFIYHIFSRWVIGRVNGAQNWIKTIQESTVDHPMALGDSSLAFAFSCVGCDTIAAVETLPACTVCAEESGQIVEPSRLDRCILSCETLQVSSSAGSLSGIFIYQGMYHLRPYFTCSTGACNGKVVWNRDGRWMLGDDRSSGMSYSSTSPSLAFWPTDEGLVWNRYGVNAICADQSAMINVWKDLGFESKQDASPSAIPSSKPTKFPTSEPTSAPTRKPTNKPTLQPTNSPTRKPTNKPTFRPTSAPTRSPTNKPTFRPTSSPTRNPTNRPTSSPTRNPTNRPTIRPTSEPTQKPLENPTVAPITKPRDKPTGGPTKIPIKKPTFEPTRVPTGNPTTVLSSKPTVVPTERKPARETKPTKTPTPEPAPKPTRGPTDKRLTESPTRKQPNFRPTHLPTGKTESDVIPSARPSFQPTISPTVFGATVTGKSSVSLNSQSSQPSTSSRETELSGGAIFGIIAVVLLAMIAVGLLAKHHIKPSSTALKLPSLDSGSSRPCTDSSAEPERPGDIVAYTGFNPLFGPTPPMLDPEGESVSYTDNPMLQSNVQD